MNDELEGLIDKQLDKMNYIPELEPKDYMVIVGFEKLHVTKIIKNRKGNVPDLTDEDMDKFLQKFTNLTFKVNASSVQEAISRVTVTTANMAYLDAIAKGFDLLAQLYSDLALETLSVMSFISWSVIANIDVCLPSSNAIMLVI